MFKQTICVGFIALVSLVTALPFETVNETTLQKEQPPLVIIHYYEGLTAAQVDVIKTRVVQVLDANPTNKDLIQTMYEFFRAEDPDSTHLVTLSKCFDYCYEGAQPKYYVVFDIDRGTNRLMISSRKAC